MSRTGVDYETIKHAAIKLLSQGHAPSVQKIRELLGTGSNTTIAEHLKVWREEHATKEIHHLPANMPKELISAIEVLWQTAMEQAVTQLTSVKNDLDAQQEKLRLDKAFFEKTDADLRLQLNSALQSLDEKNVHSHALQTDIAVLQEKLKQQESGLIIQKEQYEKKLNRIYIEKNEGLEKSEKLQSEIMRLTQELSDQNQKHQSLLQANQTLQEKSEIRWLQLIDQARTETNEQRKRLENTVNKQAAQIEKLQTMLSDSQEKYASQQSILHLKNARIEKLNVDILQIQKKYHETFATSIVLQEKINSSAKKSEKFNNTGKQKAERVL